eukprot:2741691-Pleurochrysis_carterae.AAC.1
MTNSNCKEPTVRLDLSRPSRACLTMFRSRCLLHTPLARPAFGAGTALSEAKREGFSHVCSFLEGRQQLVALKKSSSQEQVALH